jgi:hypothetical protein
MGPSWYLTRDGKVLEEDVILGTELHEIEPPVSWIAIVCGAKTLGCPELLGLLPPKPAAARICGRCGGARRSDLFAGVEEPHEPILVVCADCQGLGWLPAE